ncbi:MAG: hypothetical protein ABI809_06845 [Caldimonas sp.]
MAHQLIELLAYGEFGIEADLEVVEPLSCFQQFAHYLCHEAQRQHDIEGRPINHKAGRQDADNDYEL